MSLLASTSLGKGGADIIFAYSDKAGKRAAEIGKENVINATIGAILDANGKLITLDAVEESMRSQDFSDSANYAPINGMPKFIEAAIDAAFRDSRPDAYVGGIATPGGTGGLHNAFLNYLEQGDICITTDYFWGNYTSILEEIQRKIETFKTFDENDNFNTPACIEKVKEVAQRQKNVMLLLNTPAHNPTGMRVKDDEWKVLLKELCALANEEKNNIILVIDIAYIDFAGPDGRNFLKLFSNLPKNIFTIVTFSMSKGYTLYGYRLGCMIGISSYKEAVDEFLLANGASARATWSNCSKAGMLVMTDFYDHPEKQAVFHKQQEEFRLSLVRRGEIFMNEAKECGLRTLPYKSGFFIMLPMADEAEAVKIADAMTEENIFTVPLGKGVRIAICAITEEKIKGMAAKFKKAVDRIAK